jgi:hypothetical protein
MRAYAEGMVLMILGLVAVLGVWNVPAPMITKHGPGLSLLVRGLGFW